MFAEERGQITTGYAKAGMRPGQRSARYRIRTETAMAWRSIGFQMGRRNTSSHGGKVSETEILPSSTIRKRFRPKGVSATKSSRRPSFLTEQESGLRETSGWRLQGIVHSEIEGASAAPMMAGMKNRRVR